MTMSNPTDQRHQLDIGAPTAPPAGGVSSPPVAYRVVRTNERGWRIGEDHHNAKLTDAEVELLLALRAQGWTYTRLAATFEVSKTAVGDYCTGRRRAQTVAGHRVVPVKG